MLATKVQLKINLPADVKDWLEQQARQNLRSQNSEIILALREKIHRQNEKADALAS